MADRADVSVAIRGSLLDSWPYRFAPDELHDEVLLGEHGLGLDSIEIVEFLQACEERCGGQVTEGVLIASPLTIRSVIDFVMA